MLRFSLLFFLVISSVAFGQSPFPAFNSCSLTKIEGTVLSVQRINLVNRPAQPSLQLIVRYQDVAVAVELGPEWFLNAGGITVSSSDEVEITGSLIKIKGQHRIIASDIKINHSELKLRDEKGNPQWERCGFNVSLNDSTECIRRYASCIVRNFSVTA